MNKQVQTDVAGYLETLGYNFPEKTDGFLVADKPSFGGTRDTLLVWIPSEPKEGGDQQLELRLLHDFENRAKRYPNANLWMVAETSAGFSRHFREERERLGVNFRVPVQFFDSHYKSDELGSAAKTVIGYLYDKNILNKRIPQPYGILIDSETPEKGEDLFEHLWEEFRAWGEYDTPVGPRLRIVVGPAGIGKTWLFKSLFYRLHEHFLDRKKRQEIFRRPIPLVPEEHKEGRLVRTRDLTNAFIESELAVRIPTNTLEWQLTHGYTTWMFDGLDELYASDREFFDNILELLTYPGSQAQILICARESLLTSCEPFTEFLKAYPPGPESVIQLFRLEGWEQPSKRAFARLHLDPPKDNQFLTYISRSNSLQALSTLPYYCDLLLTEFEQGNEEEFADDFTLIAHSVSEIIKREEEKNLLTLDHFQPHGLDEWLETVASESYLADFKGMERIEMETYAALVLAPDISDAERKKTITTLVQFALFAPGLEPGVLTFQHELIAEYLAGRYWLRRLLKDPGRVARELSGRIDFADSLIGRYMANLLPKEYRGIQILTDALRIESLPGRAFTNLLQLLLMATPAYDVLRNHGFTLEGQDLSQVQFVERDLNGFSLRNCDLSNTVFRGCNLKNTLFEGACLVGTRFEQISEGSLGGAQFGNFERFDSAYIGKRPVEDRSKFAEWLREVTGRAEVIQQPCATALQLRFLFLKYIHLDGTGKRDELPERALIAGKKFPGAASPSDCLEACTRFRFLQRPTWHDRVKRVPGDRYNEMVCFVKDWQMSDSLRGLLDSICPTTGCEHLPVVK